MAYSSELHQRRGFLPPQNQEELLTMRRAEDLYRAFQRQGQARFTGFLSDRQQALARAALDKLGCSCCCFDGGYPEAQRRVLAVGGQALEVPLCFLKIVSAPFSAQTLAHPDYLGALLGLSVERDCIGDVLVQPGSPQTAYVAVLERMAGFLQRELRTVGNNAVTVCVCDRGQVEWDALPPPLLRTATVASLRLDSVLSAFLQISRTQAGELIRAGRVEIGHVPMTNAHAPVYEGDIFSVRGKGKFQLKTVGGKSKKDRLFIEFFRY